MNRLIREDNKKFGKSWIYTYDGCGNIKCKREFAFTLRETEKLEELESVDIAYTNDGNRLTEFGGNTISYDAYGNLVIYKGETLEWEYGKRLIKFGETEFGYDGTGRRVSKGGITFIYDDEGKLLKQSNGLQFVYDTNGLCGFKYRGVNYLYRKNAQGDITAILDLDGNEKVCYTYDAWGNYTISGATVLGELNPFRYRGYYYDEETQLYYLQTRYYDPETGRFISPDDVSYLDPETVNGLNLYAYCLNNPVMGVDPTGEFWDVVIDVIFIVWDIVELCINDGYTKWQNWTALGIDVLFAVVPFVTGGGGQVVKLTKAADNLKDISKVRKVSVVGQTMGRVEKAGRLFGASENLYQGFKSYEKIANTGRVIYTSAKTQKAYRVGVIIAEPLAKLHNASWLFGKLRAGYTILDIGADARKVLMGIKSSSYIMERGILTIWETRNIWKTFMHLFLRG